MAVFSTDYDTFSLSLPEYIFGKKKWKTDIRTQTLTHMQHIHTYIHNKSATKYIHIHAMHTQHTQYNIHKHIHYIQHTCTHATHTECTHLHALPYITHAYLHILMQT